MNEKRIIATLLCLVLVLLMLPAAGFAEAEEKGIYFSDLTELQGLCLAAGGETEELLICEAEGPFLISENLVIPSGITVRFRQFTVEEGTVLTLDENARILTTGFRVEGEFVNAGTVIQRASSDDEAGEIEVSAWIPGKVINRGNMELTNVYGVRNIHNYRGSLTMEKTEQPEPDETPEPGPDEKTPGVTEPPLPTVPPDPAPGLRKLLPEGLTEFLEDDLLPGVMVFVFLLVLGLIRKKAAGKAKRRAPGAGGTKTLPKQRRDPRMKTFTEPEPYCVVCESSGEDHFQRDKRNRIAQLDEWLRNGLIDRKEYLELKRRYEQDL